MPGLDKTAKKTNSRGAQAKEWAAALEAAGGDATTKDAPKQDRKPNEDVDPSKGAKRKKKVVKE